MGKKKAKSKPKKSSVKAGGGLGSVAKAGISALTGGSSSKAKSGGRRKHGVSYWANKVMVAKLKKKYFKIQYGGMR